MSKKKRVTFVSKGKRVSFMARDKPKTPKLGSRRRISKFKQSKRLGASKRIQQILQLREQGLSGEQVARKLRLNPSVVYSTFHRYGVGKGYLGRRKKRPSGIRKSSPKGKRKRPPIPTRQRKPLKPVMERIYKGAYKDYISWLSLVQQPESAKKYAEQHPNKAIKFANDALKLVEYQRKKEGRR